jgi:putative endonuclease
LDDGFRFNVLKEMMTTTTTHQTLLMTLFALTMFVLYRDVSAASAASPRIPSAAFLPVGVTVATSVRDTTTSCKVVSTASMWSIYIIRCSDDSLYTGITTDVNRRFKEHSDSSQGKLAAKYLRGKGPLKLVFESFAGTTRSEATKLELALKSLPKAKKELLVQGKLSLVVDTVLKNKVRTENNTLSWEDADPPPAPMLITIGPPCCGKTEALRSYLLSEGYDPDDVFSKDVALDDDSAVYHRIPLAAFLFPSSRLDPDIGAQLLSSGSTVQDRLLDPSYDSTDDEIRNIMLRIAGRITPQQFAIRTRERALQAGDAIKFFQKRRIAVAEDLIGAVEQVVVQAVSEVICQMQMKRGAEKAEVDELPYDEKENERDPAAMLDLSTLNATQAHLLSARALIQTPHVDLFIPHAIFRGGIDRAEEVLSTLLQSSFVDRPVSWGNTNTRPTEYVAALSAAERAGRPVKFVAWGTGRLPRVSRQELLRRNVARFRKTGRCIPAGAVGAALGRVESLVNEAQQQAEKLFGDEACPPELRPNEWENHKMDVAFAALAGFRMIEDGYVVKIDEPKYLPFRGKRKNKKWPEDSQKVGGERRKKR